MKRDGAIETWSSLVEDPARLEPELARALAAVFPSFPRCVRNPSVRAARGLHAPTLLCLGNDRVAVFRNLDADPVVWTARLTEIEAVEFGVELLYGWIAFHAGTRRETIHFNVVGESLFRPVVDAWRAAREGSGGGTGSEGGADAALEPLRRVDYRYYARPLAALGMRTPTALFHQPRERLPGGLFFPRVVASYLLAAAGPLLYAFTEKSAIRPLRIANYAMVERYFPLDGLRAEERPGESGFRTIVCGTAGAPVFDLRVSEARLDDFRRFLELAGLRPSPGAGEGWAHRD